MTPDAALKKLEDKYGERRALTLIGFAMFVEMHGAKAMRERAQGAGQAAGGRGLRYG